MVLDSIPSQLAKENKKFVYGSLKKGARAKEFELAIQWLVDAGIVVKIHMASKPSIPLKVYEDFGAFKLFLCDCGLLLSTFCNTLYPGIKGVRLSMKPYVEQSWMQNYPLCSVEYCFD